MGSPRTSEESDAYLTDEIVGILFNEFTRMRLIEATREIIAPLVKRSDVPKRLKQRALSVPPAGVHPDNMEHDRQDIRNALAGLMEANAITINARGAYESTSVAPEPNTAEAIKNAAIILDGWPEDKRDEIIAVLTGGGEPE